MNSTELFGPDGCVSNTTDINGTTIESFNICSQWLMENATDLAINALDDGLSTTTEAPYQPYELRPETYLVPIVFGLIFIVGVVGNGVLVVVFVRHRAMRNVPNTYILSLALADLMVIVTALPFVSIVYTIESWPWGEYICTLSEFAKDVSTGVSVFTLTALSSDRFFAIVDPLRKFHGHGGGRRATIMTVTTAILIWIAAIVCSIPAIVGSNIRHFRVNSHKSFSVCYPFPVEWGGDYAKSVVMFRFVVYYALPLCVIGIFYVLIFHHLMYTANVPGEMQGAVRQVLARKKVAYTVLAFVVIFGVCYLPYHVFMLWFYFYPNAPEAYNGWWHYLRIFGFCMCFANSCANPVALYYVSGAFRKHFDRYLFCRGSSGSRRRQADTLTHRDTSLTSTISRRYPSRRQNPSTIRRHSCRIQETTITMLTPSQHQLVNGHSHVEKDPDRI